MIQEYKEIYLQIEKGQTLSINGNKGFKVKLIELKSHIEKGESKLSLTIWGRKPNAVCFEEGRIFKMGEFFYKTDFFSVVTLKDETISFLGLDDLVKGKKCVNIKSCTIEATTRLNSTMVFQFG